MNLDETDLFELRMVDEQLPDSEYGMMGEEVEPPEDELDLPDDEEEDFDEDEDEEEEDSPDDDADLEPPAKDPLEDS